MNELEKTLSRILGLVLAVSAFSLLIYSINQNKHVPEPKSNTTITQNSDSSSSTPQTTQPSTPSCVSAGQATNEEGQNGCVQFTGYAYTSSSGQMYLDQSESAPYGFSVWIPAGSSFGPSLLSKYSGESIDVTGSITNYNGEPEIEVTNASQIQLAQ